MRNVFAGLCLIAAWLVFVSSVLLMCACPGIPAIGMALAALAFWLPIDGVRRGAVLAFLACLMMTGAHTMMKVKSGKARERALERAKERSGSNSVSPLRFTNNLVNP